MQCAVSILAENETQRLIVIGFSGPGLLAKMMTLKPGNPCSHPDDLESLVYYDRHFRVFFIVRLCSRLITFTVWDIACKRRICYVQSVCLKVSLAFLNAVSRSVEHSYISYIALTNLCEITWAMSYYFSCGNRIEGLFKITGSNVHQTAKQVVIHWKQCNMEI